MADPVWKGLDAERMPVFIGYDQAERMIAALLDQARAWAPDGVAGITRGGLVPATMAATLLALPLSMLGYDRATRRVSGADAVAGSRILLVDDGASSGSTLHDVRSALLRTPGLACLTLAIVHDPDGVRFLPDLSHPMRELWRFPWERGEATPAGRARRASGAGPDLATEVPVTGFDPESAAPLPDPPHIAIPIPADLRRGDISALARAKAMQATRAGCTHVIEADARQAILIAEAAPHLVVTWWSAPDARGYVVSGVAKPSTTSGPPAASASAGSCVTSSAGNPRART